MQQIGSQRRVTLLEAGYTLVGRLKGAVILRPIPIKGFLDGPDEIWYANDHHSGYTVQVGRWGYEFGCNVQTA